MPGQLLVGGGTLLDKDLNESAFFLRPLPGERLFASGDLDDEVADALRLARLHDQVLREVIALVENAQRDHAVLVGGSDLLALGRLRGPGLHSRNRIGNRGILRLGRRLALAAGGERQRQGENRCVSEDPLHRPETQASGDNFRLSPSGDQAS